MVDCHVAAFPEELPTRLGRGFLRGMYRYFLRRPEGIAFVAVGPDEVVEALVVGGEPWLRPRYVKRNILSFMSRILVKSITCRYVRQRFFALAGKGFKRIAQKLHLVSRESDPDREPADPAGKWSLLQFICSHPAYRGRGAGRALVLAFEDESRRRGYAAMRLTVALDNVPAIGLYKKCGWQEAGQTRTLMYFDRVIPPVAEGGAHGG